MAGIAHWRNGIPCQDFATWQRDPRPVLVLCDGAGSAKASHLGAQALATGLARFVTTCSALFAPWLDTPMPEAQALNEAHAWSERLLAHALGILTDLARGESRPSSDLRATALVAVIGTGRLFYWHVGDGSIAVRHQGKLETVSVGAKGEFANQTVFVDTATPQDVRCGLLSTTDIDGIALMSDGGAERLVAHKGSQVAGRLGDWFDELAVKHLTIDQLVVAYYEPRMWERTSLDDQSIVLAARVGGGK